MQFLDKNTKTIISRYVYDDVHIRVLDEMRGKTYNLSVRIDEYTQRITKCKDCCKVWIRLLYEI